MLTSKVTSTTAGKKNFLSGASIQNIETFEDKGKKYQKDGIVCVWNKRKNKIAIVDWIGERERFRCF